MLKEYIKKSDLIKLKEKWEKQNWTTDISTFQDGTLFAINQILEFVPIYSVDDILRHDGVELGRKPDWEGETEIFTSNMWGNGCLEANLPEEFIGHKVRVAVWRVN